MIPTIPHKRGDTFELLCQLLDDAGQPIDIEAAGIAVACQLRSPAGDLVATCDVTIEDQADKPGGYRLRVDDTAGWHFPSLTGDIEYVDGDNTTTTETFTVAISERQTHA